MRSGRRDWLGFKVERDDRRRDQVVFACVWAADQATRSAIPIGNRINPWEDPIRA
jgi:hypothetical protein